MSQENRPIVVGKYYDGAEGKQSYLRDVFDDTAEHYEFIAKWGWFGSGDWYRRQALLRHGLKPDMHVLDVATGTGQVARAILSIVDAPEQVECVEPSANMIVESKKTVPCKHYQSTAEQLPVEGERFNFLTMGFALRHVDSLEDSFREYRRVLKDGGKVLIMDVSVPTGVISRQLFKGYFKYVLPAISGLLTWDRKSFELMRYYWHSMDQMVDSGDVVESLERSGFKDVRHNKLLGCFSEYTGTR